MQRHCKDIHSPVTTMTITQGIKSGEKLNNCLIMINNDMFNNDHKKILFFRILTQIATSRSRLLQKDTKDKVNAL